MSPVVRHRLPAGRRLSLVAASLLWAVPAIAADPSPRFSRDILPILSDHCFACHGPDAAARKGGLRLDTHEGALAGGKEDGPAITPGDPTRSSLLRRIRHADPDEIMPPPSTHKPLSTAQIETLETWIRTGAPWGRHWAYEPIARPPLPPSNQPTARRNPIDAFIHARLAAEKLEPSPEAAPRTLLRRVTLDLTGLPPSPAELVAFESDPSPDAYERAVERLLASPRHGERMSWEWLDAARYADSNGYQGDGERTMWPWRDWVVDAFNQNLPFDAFTVWQLAGDLIPEPSPTQRLATGFARNHMINGEGGRIPEENRIDYLFDQTETVATVWLGATFNCARCHDHKFDPVSQADYFRLLALFNQTVVDGSGGDPQSRPNLEVPSRDQSAALEAIQQAATVSAAVVALEELRQFPRPTGQDVSQSAGFANLPEDVRNALRTAPPQRNASQTARLAEFSKTNAPTYHVWLDQHRQTLEQRDAIRRSLPRVMVMEDMPKPRETFQLSRGQYNKPGNRVSPGAPEGLFPNAPNRQSVSNRLDLARWLVDPAHPVPARVIANRQWQLFFGSGLVRTTEDFGLQSERPSHPDLLDWLASELIDSGWDIKHLQRLIVTSATYRQSSAASHTLLAHDPANRLLARGPRHRLPSWMIRDVALAAAGLLVERIGGPPVRAYQPDGVWEEATFGNKRYQRDSGEALYRRSLYVFWRRIVGPTLFFDVSNRQTCTVRTPRTNTPLQALLLLNDTTYVEAARLLAARLLSHHPASPARVDDLFESVLGRKPSPAESTIVLAGIERHHARFRTNPDEASKLLRIGEHPNPPGLDPANHAAWTLACSTVLNLDEALSKE